jgi:hypothetical protein
MALVYDATLRPTKLELLTGWIAAQPWAAGIDVSVLERVASYRFDDPAGEVGIETHLVRSADDRLLHVPLTYRSAPLGGAEAGLVGTTEHSVLGTRWVYDGCIDPVYATALATTILTGGREADIEFVDGRRERGPTHVRGSGRASAAASIGKVATTTDGGTTSIRSDATELLVYRVLPASITVLDVETLTATWPGNNNPVVLAFSVLAAW